MEQTLGINYRQNQNIIDSIEKALIQQGLAEYMHCYSFEFQTEVRRQISSINSVQKSLIKSIKADVMQVKKRSDYVDDIEIPRDYKHVLKLEVQMNRDKDKFFVP